MEALAESHYPALFRAADTSAVTGQHRLLVATGMRLVALLTAAVMGTLTLEVSRVDAAALLAATGLGVGLVIEVYLLTERPDRQWYEARAAAESAKTLAWRFAVGGQPFGVDEDDHTAESLLLHRFSVIRGNLRALVIDADGDGGLQVTDEMRELRAQDLDGRRRAYRTGRIEDQYRWYARRSAQHGRSVARWSVFLASLEACGLVAAVLNAVGMLGLDLPGIVGAIAAGGLAWVQTRQHQQLATAYGIAAQELAEIASRVEWPGTDPEWAHFVDEVEEAISREHTLWWASHV
ncbi:DUF4231 domain-containing protein [Actinomadura sp. 6K520]|uniref:DUF4231 domain-containing protein n=1 Tax=Actinomadura sp. 6K520 TaxID=2530364 RepID=UPI00104FDF60|nr:DUF4231 domain-containing protein [Actinomadura sp. 6K520]TDE38719.1 DUF4231 domain-containing protein [Actinomadura sp. 6K520]